MPGNDLYFDPTERQWEARQVLDLDKVQPASVEVGQIHVHITSAGEAEYSEYFYSYLRKNLDFWHFWVIFCIVRCRKL